MSVSVNNKAVVRLRGREDCKISTKCYEGLLLSELTFTCSKLTLETLEKGVKYVQS